MVLEGMAFAARCSNNSGGSQWPGADFLFGKAVLKKFFGFLDEAAFKHESDASVDARMKIGGLASNAEKRNRRAGSFRGGPVGALAGKRFAGKADDFKGADHPAGIVPVCVSKGGWVALLEFTKKFRKRGGFEFGAESGIGRRGIAKAFEKRLENRVRFRHRGLADDCAIEFRERHRERGA